MSKNKGVSIITLVITVVVMIILASVTIYNGAIKNIDTTSETMQYEEILNVAEVTAQRKLMNSMNSNKYPYVGTPLSDSAPEEVNGVSYGDGWHKLKTEDAPNLGLEGVKKEYIINYKTGEVVSTTAIYHEDKEYYSSSEIKGVLGVSDTATSDTYDVVKGVNKPELINGMIPVKYVNNKWVITNASDNAWYDYSSESKAWANVMLADEIEVVGYTNEQIRNTSLVELEGREVTTIGSMLVWIPRYTSNSAGEIMYSNLCDDYTEEGFTLSEAFTDGTKELTGIWISKYDVESN